MEREMHNEHVKVVLGHAELQEVTQEIDRLQELSLSLQAVGLQIASDRIMAACRKISDVLHWNSFDVESTEFQDPSM
jgi:hypothetical protein